MLNAIVVDDEWYNLQEISDLLDGTGFIKVIKKYQNPLMVLEEFARISPDLALVDIEMPEIDGIILAEKLLELKPDIKIVFVTSWDQYAVQAFDLNALDYIKKPIRIERFHRMIDKVRSEMPVQKKEQSKELIVRCFGQFETRIDGIPVKWERSKAEELFAYLLLNHNILISKEIILENLWPGYELKRALKLLQTSIYRIRTIFSVLGNKVSLEYSQSKYCLIITDTECDLFEVEEAIRCYKTDNKNAIDQMEKAILKYKNGFMSQQGYLWSMEKDEELRIRLTKVLRDIVRTYSFTDDNHDYLKFMKYLSYLAPYDEDVNYKILTEYKKYGNDYEALSHYHWLENTLKNDYDMVPSEKIIHLFN